MTDTEIVEWISENVDYRLRVLRANYNQGFLVGLSFRQMVEKIVEWNKGVGDD